MRRIRGLLALLERWAPTKREWGAIALAAAREAGLPEPDIASLRQHLEDEFALSGRDATVTS